MFDIEGMNTDDLRIALDVMRNELGSREKKNISDVVNSLVKAEQDGIMKDILVELHKVYLDVYNAIFLAIREINEDAKREKSPKVYNTAVVDPETGKSWSGHGRPPMWVKELRLMQLMKSAPPAQIQEIIAVENFEGTEENT